MQQKQHILNEMATHLIHFKYSVKSNLYGNAHDKGMRRPHLIQYVESLRGKLNLSLNIFSLSYFYFVVKRVSLDTMTHRTEPKNYNDIHSIQTWIPSIQNSKEMDTRVLPLCTVFV